MKNKVLIIGVFFMSSFAFANENNREKNEKEKTSQNAELTCCTRNLTYCGEVVDTETVCGFVSQQDNCNVADHNLLQRHPDTGLSDPLGK